MQDGHSDPVQIGFSYCRPGIAPVHPDSIQTVDTPVHLNSPSSRVPSDAFHPDHLAQLRAAGLITLTEQGNLTYYSLRRDCAEEAGVELRAYLAH